MKAAILLCLLIMQPAAGSQGVEAAIELYYQGKFSDAAGILSELSRKNPRDHQFRTWLGKTHLKLRRWNDAVREFEKAVELEPQNGATHLWLGRAYGFKAEHSWALTALGPAVKTRQEFERAAQLSPDSVDIRFDLLEFYLQAPGIIGGGKDKAEKQAAEIARIAPRLGHTARADIFKKEKQWESARDELIQATQKFPGDAGAYVDLAGFFFDRRDFERAEANARKALDLDGSIRAARMLVASAQVVLRRNLTDAHKTLLALAGGPLKDEDPAFEEVYYWLGQSYLAQGQKADAQRAFETSVGFNPEYSRSQEALAQVKRTR